jgi:hypothetical protein
MNLFITQNFPKNVVDIEKLNQRTSENATVDRKIWEISQSWVVRSQPRLTPSADFFRKWVVIAGLRKIGKIFWCDGAGWFETGICTIFQFIGSSGMKQDDSCNAGKLPSGCSRETVRSCFEMWILLIWKDLVAGKSCAQTVRLHEKSEESVGNWISKERSIGSKMMCLELPWKRLQLPLNSSFDSQQYVHLKYLWIKLTEL